MTSLLNIYNNAPEPFRTKLLGKLGNPWYTDAYRHQIVPEHAGVHVLTGARGTGKTRAGAEWVLDMAERFRGTRILLVGDSFAALRENMVEGESGILASASKSGRDVPNYAPSGRILEWANGSKALCTSFTSQDTLRAYAYQFAWFDEAFSSRADDRDVERVWSEASAMKTVGMNPQTLITSVPNYNWLSALARDRWAAGDPHWTLEGTL